jgi:hypothetical protein
VAGGINITNELVWELQDQVQRVERKLDWLVTQAGGDPQVISRGPDRRTPPEGFQVVV